jgi:hypothetical protein
MRFMIMVRASRDTEAGKQAPESLFAEMAAYHEALAKAGVLLDGAGLQPSGKGWRIRYAGDQRTLVDGPFAEAKELIAGYTLIQTKTRDEALEWARRYPNPAGEGAVAEIEVRQLFELEDFEPNLTLERFRDIGMGAQS